MKRVTNLLYVDNIRMDPLKFNGRPLIYIYERFFFLLFYPLIYIFECYFLFVILWIILFVTLLPVAK